MGATGGSSLDPYYDIILSTQGILPFHHPISSFSSFVLYSYLDNNAYNITWNRRTLIKNYQGSGYVYDTVIGDYSSSTNIVSITASDILTTTYLEEYIETFTCLFDCINGGGMKIYEE